MKPHHPLIIASSCFFCSCLFAYEQQIITADERKPFHYQTDQGDISGSAAKTLTCALDKMDVRYIVKFLPWLRAQTKVKQGKASAFFAASQSNTRDEYATLSIPFVKQSWNWYVLKGSNLLPDSLDFKHNAQVTGIFGANASVWAKNNGYNLVVHKLDNLNSMVTLAELKRVDAIFGSSVLFNEYLTTHNKMHLFDIIVESDKSWGIYYSNDYLSRNTGFLEELNSNLKLCTQ
ncbi:transporter substrate-binding domain-containing protein [Vibrio profundum]|uniref:substrate-binding periplasmic protein n=1 Tax=Vibrio profundum TaxID=2910247 RepID=UPI003D137A3F